MARSFQLLNQNKKVIECEPKILKYTFCIEYNVLHFVYNVIGKCIFDKWGKFGPCQNGVKTKRRRVLQGSEKCERRAVRMRKCKH